MVSVTGPNNQTTHYDYDALNRQISMTDPLNHATITDYDIFGNKHRIEDAKGNETFFTYNYANKLVSVTDALTKTTSYSYDRMGNMTRMARPGAEGFAPVTNYSYDELGRLVLVQDNQNHMTEYRYDAVGNRVYAKDPNGNESVYIYNPDNTLDKVIVSKDEAEQKRIEYTYDSANQVIGIVQKKNNNGTVEVESSLSKTYSPSGQITSETRGGISGYGGLTTGYRYDVLGNVIGVHYPGSGSTEDDWLKYERNALGQLTRIPGFTADTGALTYNNGGFLSEFKFKNGIVSTYLYYDDGRLQSRTDTLNGEQKLQLALTYYENGNIHTRGSNTYEYDAIGQLKKANVENNEVLEFQRQAYDLEAAEEDYSGNGLRQLREDEVKLDYAASSVYLVFDGVKEGLHRIELTPQAAGHRLNNRRYLTVYKKKDDGTFGKITNEEWEFTLDPASGKMTITLRPRINTSEIRIHCLFDERTESFGALDASTFHFPALAGVKVFAAPPRREENYTYDERGNRIASSKTLLVNDGASYSYYPNSDRLQRIQLTNGEEWAFIYDANGNLIEKGNRFEISNNIVTILYASPGVIYWTYKYDCFNRLAKASRNGENVAEFIYDPTGLRIAKTINDSLIEVYAYDQNGNLIYREQPSGSVYSYVWLGRQRLARVDSALGGNGAKYFFHNDQAGSPLVVTDETGNLVWRGEFTPYGDKWNNPDKNWTFSDSGGFTGKDFDEGIELYYFNARWYDGSIGRFLTADSYPGSTSNPKTFGLYVYSGNNSINYVDPTGHNSEYITFEINWNSFFIDFNPSFQISDPLPLITTTNNSISVTPITGTVHAYCYDNLTIFGNNNYFIFALLVNDKWIILDNNHENQYTKSNYTFEQALSLQMKRNPQIQSKGRWIDATDEQVMYYMNPSNFSTGIYKYQFLDLSASTGISSEAMAKYLANRGILSGKEEIFLEASRIYHISEIYLAAHAALETGNGSSQLANGVIINGVKVYNMFGIGAYDGDPIGSGAKYAYAMGWTTPEKAIMGGAKFISEQYINNPKYGQNTLYEMRWNPMSPGQHQYATDIRWAINQCYSIKNMYDSFVNPILVFDYPLYLGGAFI